MSLLAGTLGIDFAGLRLDTAAKVSEAKAAHGRFVVRYSAGAGNSDSKTAWKRVTPAEFRKLVADGFDVIANSEWYESRVTEGTAAGHADGAADLVLWKSCGYARGGVIIVSWDQAPSASKYDAVAAYLKAYETALAGYYTLGLYAGSAAIREMKRRGLITCGWQMMSTSFSDNGLPYQPSPQQVAHALAAPPAGIDLWQTGNKWFAGGADEDVVLRAGIKSHLTAAARPTPGPSPNPQPGTPYYDATRYPSALVARNGAFTVYLEDDGRLELRHNGQLVGYYTRSGS